MVLEEISTSLIMWFSCALIPCLLIDAVAVLPAPQNLSVQSTNMKHVLTWSPVVVPEEIIHYSVEYQGEYESLYMSHIWIPSSWCSPTAGPECDITDDITATVPYNLRVRAVLGSQTSAWSTLKQPFNQNSTILTPPGMEVTQDGFHLVIKLEDLGPQFEYFVAYWRKESGAEEHVKMVMNGGVPVHLETMEPGSAYCVKAQTFVKAIGRHSAFSQAECVKVQGETLPLALALFAFVGFTLILVVVPLSVWKMGRLLRHACCPVVVLPDTLIPLDYGQQAEGWPHVSHSLMNHPKSDFVCFTESGVCELRCFWDPDKCKKKRGGVWCNKCDVIGRDVGTVAKVSQLKKQLLLRFKQFTARRAWEPELPDLQV